MGRKVGNWAKNKKGFQPGDYSSGKNSPGPLNNEIRAAQELQPSPTTMTERQDENVDTAYQAFTANSGNQNQRISVCEVKEGDRIRCYGNKSRLTDFTVISVPDRLTMRTRWIVKVMDSSGVKSQIRMSFGGSVILLHRDEN